MKYTILGASGFIGRHVAGLARNRGHDVYCPGRDENLNGRALGHAIYCIGMTADFRQRPHETVTAHVTKLQEVLTKTSFESLVYLSSTRVYSRCFQNMEPRSEPRAVSETIPIPVLPSDFSDIYNLSKLMGESIALAHGSSVRIARLSNVMGPDFNSDNFLSSVLRDCVRSGGVILQTSLDSAKDYIALADVASVLLRLGPEGRSPIYNVASGRQTTNGEIVAELSRLTGASITVALGAPLYRFPPIDTTLMKNEFGFLPQSMDAMLRVMVDEFQRHFAPLARGEAG